MIRGPLVILGYYRNDQATRAAIGPDGWLHTGDVATRDDEATTSSLTARKT
jgi:long-chain acyl-CoA synthetase